MPLFEVSAPDGKKFEVNAPEGATQDDAIAYVRNELWRPEKPVEPPPQLKRTFGEAALDVPAGLMRSFGSLAQLPENVAELVGGRPIEDYLPTRLGKKLEKYGEELKSPALKQKEEQLGEKIQKQEGFLNEAKTAILGTLTDPALLANFITEQIPNFIGSAGAGALAKGGVKALLKDATEQAVKRAGVGAAVGTEAIMQGVDSGTDAYERIYDELKKRGVPDEKAQVEALERARAATIQSAAATAGLAFIPGATKIEQALTRSAGPSKFTNKYARGFERFAGEPVSEGLQEFTGQLASNVAVQGVIPETDIFKGTGAATGLGALGGALFGLPAGILNNRQVSQLEQLQQKAKDTGETQTTILQLPYDPKVRNGEVINSSINSTQAIMIHPDGSTSFPSESNKFYQNPVDELSNAGLQEKYGPQKVDVAKNFIQQSFMNPEDQARIDQARAESVRVQTGHFDLLDKLVAENKRKQQEALARKDEVYAAHSAFNPIFTDQVYEQLGIGKTAKIRREKLLDGLDRSKPEDNQKIFELLTKHANDSKNPVVKKKINDYLENPYGAVFNRDYFFVRPDGSVKTLDEINEELSQVSPIVPQKTQVAFFPKGSKDVEVFDGEVVKNKSGDYLLRYEKNGRKNERQLLMGDVVVNPTPDDIDMLKAQRELTEAEKDLRENDVFKKFLMKHGINSKERKDIGGFEGVSSYFRDNGLRMDELLTAANEAGLIPRVSGTQSTLTGESLDSEELLRDYISRALSGDVVPVGRNINLMGKIKNLGNYIDQLESSRDYPYAEDIAHQIKKEELQRDINSRIEEMYYANPELAVEASPRKVEQVPEEKIIEQKAPEQITEEVPEELTEEEIEDLQSELDEELGQNADAKEKIDSMSLDIPGEGTLNMEYFLSPEGIFSRTDTINDLSEDKIYSDIKGVDEWRFAGEGTPIKVTKKQAEAMIAKDRALVEKVSKDLEKKNKPKQEKKEKTELTAIEKEALEIADKIESYGQKGFAGAIRTSIGNNFLPVDEKKLAFWKKKEQEFAAQVGKAKEPIKEKVSMENYAKGYKNDIRRLQESNNLFDNTTSDLVEKTNNYLQKLTDKLNSLGYSYLSDGIISAEADKLKTKMSQIAGSTSRLLKEHEHLFKNDRYANQKKYDGVVKTLEQDFEEIDELLGKKKTEERKGLPKRSSAPNIPELGIDATLDSSDSKVIQNVKNILKDYKIESGQSIEGNYLDAVSKDLMSKEERIEAPPISKNSVIPTATIEIVPYDGGFLASSSYHGKDNGYASPISIFEKPFKTRQEAIEAMSRKIRQRATADKNNIALKWLNSLEKKSKFELLQPTEKLTKNVDELARRMRKSLDQMGLKEIGLNLEKNLKEMVNGKLTPVSGKYLEKVISVSLESNNVFRTLNHEAIHALKALGMFSDAEWAVLENYAEKHWMKDFNIAENYAEFTKEEQIEEAIAHAFPQYLKYGGREKTLLQRIGEVLQRIRNILRGMGFMTNDMVFNATPEDVFRKVKEGRLEGAKQVGKGNLKTKMDKGVELFQVPLSQDEQKYFASVFENRGEEAELLELVPSAKLSGTKLIINPNDISGLDDYLADTWASGKKQYGGQGASTLPKSFASSGYKFLQKVRNANTKPMLEISKDAFKEIDPQYAKQLLNTFGPKEKSTIREKFDELKPNFFNRIVNGMFDEFGTIRDLALAAKEGGNVNNLASKFGRAYMLARMSKATDGGLSSILHYGQLELKDGAIAVKPNTKGLIEIYQPIGNEVDQYQIWKALNREAQLPDDKKSFDKNMVARRNELIKGTINGKSRAEVYSQVLKDEKELNKSVLDIAKEQGLITQDAYNIFANDIFYVPFYKAMEEENGINTFSVDASSKLTNQYFSKALKGGEKRVNDLTENMLLNWSHILSASMKNKAGVETLKAATQMKVAEKVKSTYEGKDVIKVRENGEIAYYAVNDPNLLDCISLINYVGPKNIFLNTAKGFNNMLRYGVTLSPAYKVRNLIRDTIQSAAVSPLSMNIAGNLMNGLKLTQDGNPTYMQALAGGGIFEMGSTYEGDQARLTKRLIKKGVSEKNIWDSPEKIIDGLESTLDWYQKQGGRFENANRVALYDKLIKEGKTHLEASFAARDLMDFSLQGSFRAVKILSQTIPFFNARLQGLYKLGRDGVTPTYRVLYNTATGKEIDASDKQKALQFSVMTSAVALASIFMYLSFKDDDDFKKREDWDRDNYWWFKVGDEAIRIPKPFEIGAFGTIAERTVEQIVDKNIEGEVFGKRLYSILKDQFHILDIPQIIKPVVDIYSNKDSFTGAPIESAGLERLSKQERITNDTSRIAIALGGISKMASSIFNGPGAEGISPVQIDYAIKAYLGWVGASSVAISDKALDQFGDVNRPSKSLADIAGLSSFAKSLPDKQSRWVTDFYESNQRIQQAYSDMKNYATIGDQEKVQKIFEEKGDLISMQSMYDQTSKQIAQYRAYVKQVTNLPNMSKEDKENEIKRAQVIMSDLAKLAEESRLATRRRGAQ